MFIDENENHHFDEKNELKIEYFPKIKRKVLSTPGIIKKCIYNGSIFYRNHWSYEMDPKQTCIITFFFLFRKVSYQKYLFLLKIYKIQHSNWNKKCFFWLSQKMNKVSESRWELSLGPSRKLPPPLISATQTQKVNFGVQKRRRVTF